MGDRPNLRAILATPATPDRPVLRVVIALIGCGAVMAVALLLAFFAGIGYPVGWLVILVATVLLIIWIVMKTLKSWEGRVIMILAVQASFVISIPISFVWLPFLRAWTDCGHQPVVMSYWAADDVYWLPGDPGYGPVLFGGQYACTEAEARARGPYHRAWQP
jgi:hypothetical protein